MNPRRRLCPGCSYRDLPAGASFCAPCAQQLSLPVTPPPRRDAVKPTVLPSPQKWALLFRGGRLDDGRRIPGAADDADRLAKRGAAAMAQARAGGKGYPSSHRGPEGGAVAGGEGHSDPVFRMATAGAPDPEAEIAAALHLAVEGARLLQRARNTIDRLVPETAEGVVNAIPIGSRPVSDTACMVCEQLAARLVRGMCGDCRAEWRDAGHPDVGLWVAQRRNAAAADADDELAARRAARQASRAAAIRRLVG